MTSLLLPQCGELLEVNDLPAGEDGFLLLLPAPDSLGMAFDEDNEAQLFVPRIVVAQSPFDELR